MKKIRIAPSILSADFSKMGEEIVRMEKAGADLLHCDIMDGMFVPNITFGPKMIKDIRKHTKLELDVHLMINNPERYIDNFIDAGADYVTIHVESTDKVMQCLEQIKKTGIKCGCVISPDTKVTALSEYVNMCDMILLMSVYPGFGGQKFIEGTLDKIRELDSLVKKSGKNIDIQIDGGINLDNVAIVKQAGANILVAGNTVFTSSNPRETIKRLREI